MRVLVTGATGFVGSHVARALVARGHEVHALVQGERADEERLVERTGDAAAAIGRVRGDLLAPGSYAAALAALRPEACVHLAWYANPRDYLAARVNVDLLAASARLATSLVDLGCRRIVAAGTCFEYDTSLGFLSETTPERPRHLYASCKRALHEVMTHLVAGTATSLAWARLFFLYGPHESRGRLVPAVIDAVVAGEDARVSTGEQIRDFLHVADAAAALVHVLEDGSLVGPINVASGRPVTVREVVETIARVAREVVPGAAPRIAWGAVTPRPDDPPFVCGDVRKLRRSGFVPAHDLAAGLRDTVRWSVENRRAG